MKLESIEFATPIKKTVFKQVPEILLQTLTNRNIY